jgi:carbamoylphosphate synthase large subunit
MALGLWSESTAEDSSLKPTVLIIATCRWLTAARIAIALSQAGCAVDGVCPSRHPLKKTSAVRNLYTYSGLRPLASLADAIRSVQPDLVLPTDDLAVRHLHDLHQKSRRQNSLGAALCEVIERSLGAPEGFPVLESRSAFIELARREGIPAPMTEVISSEDDLQDCVYRQGFPVVLKADGTCSGEGVRIVRSLEEGKRAFRALQAPPLWARAFKRAIINQDTTLVRPVLSRLRSTVNAQAFVAGRDATTLVACWKGEVLAALHFEVLQKQYPLGSATVLRRINHSGMKAAAEKMVCRLGVSGFCGFDFVLDDQARDAYLLEINPRATQVAHLTLGTGCDLPAALYAALALKTPKECVSVTENTTIALFPQEWIRNPRSPYMESAYHDVPWAEPDLIRACVRKRRKWSTFGVLRKKTLEVLDPDRPPLC